MVGVLGLYVCQAAFHEISYLSMDNALLFFLAGVTTAVHGQLLGQPARESDGCGGASPRRGFATSAACGG